MGIGLLGRSLRLKVAVLASIEDAGEGHCMAIRRETVLD
jgi:hypothetical protein